MSILIKGMKMPTKGSAILEINADGSCCNFEMLHYGEPIATAVELPPHGRLIDADALTDTIDSTDWYHQAPNKEMVHGANNAEHQAWYKEQDIYSAITIAPTIIEAEVETNK